MQDQLADAIGTESGKLVAGPPRARTRGSPEILRGADPSDGARRVQEPTGAPHSTSVWNRDRPCAAALEAFWGAVEPGQHKLALSHGGAATAPRTTA